ncbi:MAG: hypothetical protein JSV33_14435 [bacterium]|nr:MAG: hypothetical protein JSV33_14435 [bacterium]
MDGKRESPIAYSIFILLLFLSALTFVVDLPPILRFVCAFLQVFYLPGTVFMVFLGNDRRSRIDNLYLPPILSPIVVVLLMLASHAIAGSFHASLRISFAALYLLLVIGIVIRRAGYIDIPATVSNKILWVSIFFAGLIAIAYVANDYLFAWDTVRPTAVSNEILYRAMPPKEPFFADISIRTMWFYHLFQAVWKELSGLPILHTQWIFNMLSAFFFVYVVARFTSIFTEKTGHILLTPLFSIAGLYSAAWVLWPMNLVRAFFGDVRGPAEISRILADIDINSRQVISFLSPPMTFPINMFDRFITIGIFHYPISLFLLAFVVMLDRDFQRRSICKAALTLALIIAGAFLFRIVTGTALILAIVLGGCLFILKERLREHRHPPAFQSYVAPVIAAAVIVLGGIYYKSLTGELRSELFLPKRLMFSARSIVTIAAPLIVLLPFSIRALRKILGSHEIEHGILAAWMIPLAISSILIDLRGTMESYFIFPIFLLLAPSVVMEITNAIQTARAASRVFLISWIVILFVFPSILTLRGLMLDKPEWVHLRRRYYVTDEQRSVYSWIRDNTDINAVIIEKNEFNVMPFFANRRNFYLAWFEQRNFGYRGERVEWHKRIRDSLFSDEPLQTDTIHSLRGFDFDIYLVVWRENLEESPELLEKFSSSLEFTVRYENPAGTVYELLQ